MMALLKMWCLLPFAALLLLSIIPTTAEVVRSMSDCTGFLLQETPPRVPGILEDGNILDQNRYKPICQTLNDSKSFVTLYDTTNRIPVFSASKYNGSKGKRPQPPWKIEPQLENPREDKNMKVSDRYKKYTNQAGECDYRNNPQRLDRGHLFPSSYGHTENDKNSTFTLTNVVPQEGPFNKGSWSKMEQCIKCVMDDYCINNNGQVEGFLVTGAQPGNNKLRNRVNIPSMLWSAFCCYSRSKGWLASAHWGQNIRNGSKYLQTKTLEDLNDKLSTASSRFEAFPGTRCPLHTTVTQFYPEVKEECNCPPHISTASAPPTNISTPSVSTTAPFGTTSAPPSSTSVPLSTTPETPTSGSFTTTSASPATVSTPPVSTTAPFRTTSAPASSTSAPLSTTPETATSGSFPTTSASPATTTGHATTRTPSTTATTPITTETPTPCDL